jgi:hypothetical protein
MSGHAAGGARVCAGSRETQASAAVQKGTGGRLAAVVIDGDETAAQSFELKTEQPLRRREHVARVLEIVEVHLKPSHVCTVTCVAYVLCECSVQCRSACDCRDITRASDLRWCTWQHTAQHTMCRVKNEGAQPPVRYSASLRFRRDSTANSAQVHRL